MKLALQTMLATAGMAALAFFGAGCGSNFQPSIQPQLSPALASATVTVDMVGINESELGIWRSKDVLDYFSAGDTLRESANKITFTFEQEASAILSSSDPIWEQWKRQGVAYVVVMADLPGFLSRDSKRRQIIPLDGERWADTPNMITVSISEAGLTLLPAPVQPVN